MRHNLVGAIAALFAIAVVGPAALAEKSKFSLSGWVESHIRFSLPGKALERNAGEFAFNENRVSLQGDVDLTDKVSARIQLRTIFFGFSEIPDGIALTSRAQIDTFWWEADAAYVDLRDLGVDGLDLRLGRQIVQWGTGDKFNPTNNLNAYDFRDPITFGQPIANNMIKVDYNAGKGVALTGVWVPIFRSAQIPLFGLRAFNDIGALTRRYGGSIDPVTQALIDGFFGSGQAIDVQLQPNPPGFSLRNSMAAAKVAFKLFDIDFSISYFRGFFNLPRASEITVDLAAAQNGVQPVGVRLEYPSMHVIGFDLTTSIDSLGGLGFWVEGAIVFHDDLLTKVKLSGIQGLGDINLTEAEGGFFWKLTAGIDYTFNKYLYANIQYLHGFVDEFGSPLIKDYVVAGFDLKNRTDTVMLRLFGVLNLQDRSHVWYPVLIFKPWSSTEFHIGALLYGGEATAKFGGLDTGSNLFFTKARISF